jgi:predicted  nucleic acid-binding Zn-ribbon protein
MSEKIDALTEFEKWKSNQTELLTKLESEKTELEERLEKVNEAIKSLSPKVTSSKSTEKSTEKGRGKNKPIITEQQILDALKSGEKTKKELFENYSVKSLDVLNEMVKSGELETGKGKSTKGKPPTTYKLKAK